MEAVPPLLAGAIIELRDGGGFTAFRRPPLRSKGLPSATQVNKGLARSAKERRSPPRNSSNEKSGAKQGRGHAAELTADTKAEFSTLLERRDDILQVGLSLDIRSTDSKTPSSMWCVYDNASRLLYYTKVLSIAQTSPSDYYSTVLVARRRKLCTNEARLYTCSRSQGKTQASGVQDL